VPTRDFAYAVSRYLALSRSNRVVYVLLQMAHTVKTSNHCLFRFESVFSRWKFDDNGFIGPAANAENAPEPILVSNDKNNDTTGQLPGTCTTTRRDSHGAAATLDRKYVHVVDRIQHVSGSSDSLSLNDPAPDLLKITPDGKYLMIAFRGPAVVALELSS